MMTGGEQSRLLRFGDLSVGGGEVNAHTGWYVRVWVGNEEADDPAYDTALYIAASSTPAEAEKAVQRFRGKSGERVEVLESDNLASVPALQPGEVRRIKGAA